MRLRPTLLNASKAWSHLSRNGFSKTSIRRLSNIAEIASELKSRPYNITYDNLTPTPSHLLNISLPESIPDLCKPQYYRDPSNASILPHLPPSGASSSQLQPLPQGDHLVYFPPPIPLRDLLPDGTDTLHSPSAPTPFTRRLWAGGQLTFNPSTQNRLALNGARAACIERIEDAVAGWGSQGGLFVTIKRKIGYVHPHPYTNERMNRQDAIKRIWSGPEAAVEEERSLVFLSKKIDRKEEKIIKPPHSPDFSFSFLPTPSLLFRFSALTFNAHKIHFDINYTKETENYQKLLVHGPLTVVLMFRVLQSQLKKGEMIRSLRYRNIAPLYVREKIKVCVRKAVEEGEGKYRVWIEGPAGGCAVKGAAMVEKWSDI